MFTEAEFTRAIESAAAQLESAQLALRQLACPKIASLATNLRDLTAPQIERLLADVPTGYRKRDKEDDHVYIIRSSAGPTIVATLAKQLAEARKAHADYSRLNGENLPTSTLYVGRSKTLRVRLRQHLGAEGRGVFSLHLQRWASSNDAMIQISILQFSGVDDLLVQAVEDGLWASLRPAFGRKGER